MALNVAAHIAFDIVAGTTLGIFYALLCTAFSAMRRRGQRSSNHTTIA